MSPPPTRPQPLSPLQEVPDSPEAAAAALQEEEANQRGGVFGRLLSQLFDQSTWQQDPTWHHGTAGEPPSQQSALPCCMLQPFGCLRRLRCCSPRVPGPPLPQPFSTRSAPPSPAAHAEFDVVGGTDVQLSITSPHGSVLASGVTTAAVAAHPSKQL